MCLLLLSYYNTNLRLQATFIIFKVFHTLLILTSKEGVLKSTAIIYI